MVKLRVRVFDHCYDRLDGPDFLLRQWTALCIAQIWDCNDEIKVYGVDLVTQDKLTGMLADDSTEVRAAVYALGLLAVLRTRTSKVEKGQEECSN